MKMALGYAYLLLLLLFQTIPHIRGVKTATEKFGESSCGELLSMVTRTDHGNIEALLPTARFWDYLSGETVKKNDILMVDVDMHTWELLMNQVVALKKSGSKLAENLFAIAYDNNTCSHLASERVHCYYSHSWINQLASKYKEQTSHDPPGMLDVVMMGRMITTTVALCEGHNVFLTDTDVVFYQNPIQYAFHEANIMVTATPIGSDFINWGDYFFADQPSQYFTLNNGVVFYRSNPVTRSFILTLVAHSFNGLNSDRIAQEGFLQKKFNGIMIQNKLYLQPCSKISNPVTYLLNDSHVSNAVGECYDCYYGHFPWHSDVVHLPTELSHHHAVLKIGIYRMQRFTSYCDIPKQRGFKTLVSTAAYALQHNDTSHWGWGALEHHASRVLFTHANCAEHDPNAIGANRFEMKVNWFRTMDSWFL